MIHKSLNFILCDAKISVMLHANYCSDIWCKKLYVLSKSRCTGIIGRAPDKRDGCMLEILRPFKQYFSHISGRREVDNERLCAMELRLQFRRVCLEQG